ncbi:unnamed protein product [Lactuca virosa]|uniref:DUF659 domain-containing protein n=1 Tax=Lactuca virosa TaxID=75947 RepID=A0AAU9MX70_9ASTR|nr:unnamed protein product [Lactuca virosa]
MYELRVPLLKNEVESTHKVLKEYKQEWAVEGCSILLDGCRDSTVHKYIVNFLVNSPKGSVFLKSLDVSEIKKDANTLFKMLDGMVDEIGKENVVQVVTDNASNYVKAGTMLEVIRPHLYWTHCAHCIDLMLEDIGKIPKMQNTLKGAMFYNGYIYNHVGIVNMMRRFTNQRNLYRSAIMIFATSFITLSQMHIQKNNLRKMITSPEWNNTKWSKDVVGKRLTSNFLQERFWRNIVYALKLTGPLVKVLRMVDGDKKLAMGYIYESMDRAKETIAATFLHKEEHYKKAFEYIDARWDCQLHRLYMQPGFS